MSFKCKKMLQFEAAPPSRIPFDFTFRITGSAWATARFQLPDRTIQVTASGLFSEAAPDLVSAVEGLLAGRQRVDFSWKEEPGEYRWVFDRAEDQTRLRILELGGTRGGHFSSLPLNRDPELISRGYAGSSSSSSSSSSEYAVALDVTAKTQDVAVAIVEGISYEYTREGELGYWEEWGRPFPRSELWRVRDALGLPALERCAGSTLRTEHELERMERAFQLVTENVWARNLVERACADALDAGPSSPLLTLGKRALRRLMRTSFPSNATDLMVARETRDQWMVSRAEYEVDPLAWMYAESERRGFGARPE